MRSGELLKLQRETSKAILSHLIYDMEEKESEATVRYEGDSAASRLERVSATEGIDYDNLERIIKYDEIDEYGDEDWNLCYAAANPIHSITIHHYHTVKPHVHVAAALNGMRLLHMRLSHFNMRKIRKSIQHDSQFGKHFSLDKLKDLKEPSDKTPCKACLLGISHDPSKHRSHKRAESCGDLIHTDIAGPVETSIDGYRWLIHFTDDHSRYTYVYGVTSQKRLRSTAAGYTSATSKHFNADRYDGNLSIGVQRALPY
ncbi:hypothetical protein NFJ02_40g105480 [Pycnococcus provasolii]